MTKATTTCPSPVTPQLQEAWNNVGDSFERFCLTAGIEALQAMMEADTVELCGDMRRIETAANAGAALLEAAENDGSDLLVMGCYGHSRFREFVFGGASRHVLQHMHVPVLMSH